jgi:hypothetical protein
MMNDERYLMLPSHVRVVTGANLEEKCNLVVSEEHGYGYLLFKAAVSCFNGEDFYPISGLVVLCFKKEGYEGFRHGLIKK